MTSRAKPTTGAEAVARWTDLVVEAERSIAHPTRSTEKLESACAWARRATIPAGELTRDNPFLKLLDTAQAFAQALTARRPVMADDLRRALDEAASLRRFTYEADDAPSPAPTSPPSLPFRADIDG